MPQDLARLLEQTINREVEHLRAMNEQQARTTPRGPGSWSAAEELGHLIDSAANNHIRFVLAFIDGEFRGLGYAQDKWVAAHGYGEIPWPDLVELWYRYNSLLAHLIARIPEQQMNNRCVIGWGVLTLRFIIEDYVLHMQHHLDHILSRDPITQYPAATSAVATTD